MHRLGYCHCGWHSTTQIIVAFMLKILTCGWSVCDVDHCTCLRAGISRLYGGVHYQRYTLILILHTSDSAPVHGKCSSVILSMVTQASKSRSWLSAVLAIDCWGNVLEPGLMKLRQFFELKFPNSVDHCTLHTHHAVVVLPGTTFGVCRPGQQLEIMPGRKSSNW